MDLEDVRCEDPEDVLWEHLEDVRCEHPKDIFVANTSKVSFANT